MIGLLDQNGENSSKVSNTITVDNSTESEILRRRFFKITRLNCINYVVATLKKEGRPFNLNRIKVESHFSKWDVEVQAAYRMAKLMESLLSDPNGPQASLAYLLLLDFSLVAKATKVFPAAAQIAKQRDSMRGKQKKGKVKPFNSLIHFYVSRLEGSGKKITLHSLLQFLKTAEELHSAKTRELKISDVEISTEEKSVHYTENRKNRSSVKFKTLENHLITSKKKK